MTRATIAAAPAAFSPDVQSAPLTQARSCPNCATTAIGEFCHACGSRVDAARLTLGAMAGEVAAQVIELDHGIVHTMVALVKKPGPTIRGYFAGRRRGLTSPLTFVGLSAALSLLLSSSLPAYKLAREEQFKAMDTYRQIYSPKQFELFSSIEHSASDSKALVLVLLLIPATLTLRFMFRKQRLNLAEMGAVVCYMFGVTTFATVVIGVPLALLGKVGVESTLGLVLTFAFMLHFAFGLFGRSFTTAWRAVWGLMSGMFLMQGTLMVIPYILAR
ncbi:MAG TPA: DUF3667 domain-containing protein [Gemmatimonadaceae bacterium]|jgi:hypothetical protein